MLFNTIDNALMRGGNGVSHYNDVIMGTIVSQITSLTIVYSTVYSDADQRKHQRSASLAFVPGIHRGPVNSPHTWPVTRKMVPFDDVIMNSHGIDLVIPEYSGVSSRRVVDICYDCLTGSEPSPFAAKTRLSANVALQNHIYNKFPS